MRRGDEHFDALQNSMHEFFGREPYEIIGDSEPESGQHVMRIKLREWPPHEWSPVIGDIVHNTRSALDHLAWQLVKRNRREPIVGKTQFPIFSIDPFDRNAYPTTKKWKRALSLWDRQTEGMHPRDIAFLKDLQPYTREDDPAFHPLHRLREISNWDKHRELHFAAIALVGHRYWLKEGTRNARVIPLRIRARTRVSEESTEVARFTVIPTGPDAHVNVHIEVFGEIAFGKGSPLEGLGVQQTLHDIGFCVFDILARFKIYFAGQMF